MATETNPYTYTPNRPPPPQTFFPVEERKNRWVPLLNELRDNNPDEWVQLNDPMSQSDAQYLTRAARSMVKSGLYRNVEVTMRTHTIFEERHKSGAKKRNYTVFIRVASDIQRGEQR